MKDVFIVYGRKYWSEAVFDHDNNYFGESNIYGVFESYNTALTEFKKCVKEAHQHFSEDAPWSLDEDLVDKARDANPFENYNMYEDDYDEGDVQWSYEECEGEYAEWQMYPLAIDTTLSECPILAGIYIVKKELES